MCRAHPGSRAPSFTSALGEPAGGSGLPQLLGLAVGSPGGTSVPCALPAAAPLLSPCFSDAEGLGVWWGGAGHAWLMLRCSAGLGWQLQGEPAVLLLPAQLARPAFLQTRRKAVLLYHPLGIDWWKPSLFRRNKHFLPVLGADLRTSGGLHLQTPALFLSHLLAVDCREHGGCSMWVMLTRVSSPGLSGPDPELLLRPGPGLSPAAGSQTLSSPEEACAWLKANIGAVGL